MWREWRLQQYSLISLCCQFLLVSYSLYDSFKFKAITPINFIVVSSPLIHEVNCFIRIPTLSGNSPWMWCYTDPVTVSIFSLVIAYQLFSRIINKVTYRNQMDFCQNNARMLTTHVCIFLYGFSVTSVDTRPKLNLNLMACMSCERLLHVHFRFLNNEKMPTN